MVHKGSWRVCVAVLNRIIMHLQNSRFQLHLTLYPTPLQLVSAMITCQMSKDCLLPVWARAKSLDIDKSLGSPNETSTSGCSGWDFSSGPRWGDEKHQQHQKGSPYSSLAGCKALQEGEIINSEVLTREYELLLVFEVTGGCGRRQKKNWSLVKVG